MSVLTDIIEEYSARLLRHLAGLIALIVFMLFIFPVCASAESPVISYTEQTDCFDNPERGFYVPVLLKLKSSGTSIPENQLKKNLIHLRADIREFGDTGKKLSEDALQALDQTLRLIENNGDQAFFGGEMVAYYGKDTPIKRSH